MEKEEQLVLEKEGVGWRMGTALADVVFYCDTEEEEVVVVAERDEMVAAASAVSLCFSLSAAFCFCTSWKT